MVLTRYGQGQAWQDGRPLLGMSHSCGIYSFSCSSSGMCTLTDPWQARKWQGRLGVLVIFCAPSFWGQATPHGTPLADGPHVVFFKLPWHGKRLLFHMYTITVPPFLMEPFMFVSYGHPESFFLCQSVAFNTFLQDTRTDLFHGMQFPS